jgi:hypothetical protein
MGFSTFVCKVDRVLSLLFDETNNPFSHHVRCLHFQPLVNVHDCAVHPDFRRQGSKNVASAEEARVARVASKLDPLIPMSSRFLFQGCVNVCWRVAKKRQGGEAAARLLLRSTIFCNKNPYAVHNYLKEH